MSGMQIAFVLNAAGLMYAGGLYGRSIINQKPMHAYLFSIGLHCIGLLVSIGQMIRLANV